MSDLPPPSQPPFRSVALLHAALAVVILVVAAISGGGLVRGVLVAAGYFVAATAWSSFRFRQREARAAAARSNPEARE